MNSQRKFHHVKNKIQSHALNVKCYSYACFKMLKRANCLKDACGIPMTEILYPQSLCDIGHISYMISYMQCAMAHHL